MCAYVYSFSLHIASFSIIVIFLQTVRFGHEFQFVLRMLAISAFVCSLIASDGLNTSKEWNKSVPHPLIPVSWRCKAFALESGMFSLLTG